MSFSNTLNNSPRSIVFKNENKELARSPNALESDNIQKIPFIIKGQGAFSFSFKDFPLSQDLFVQEKRHLTIFNDSKRQYVTIEFSYNQISFYFGEENLLIKSFDKPALLNYELATYWFGLDALTQTLTFGIGEVRFETILVSFNYEKELEGLNPKIVTDCLVDANEIHIHNSIQPIKLFRDPIVAPVPLIVRDVENITMDDIADNSILPKANLSPVTQKLFDNIAGKNFTLNTPDFPQFSQAIEYSIATKDCWCHEELKRKSKLFGSEQPLQTYLRITLGKNSGESPGVPYVMEIWPPGHYSPIHNHAGANAIIRVLHGAISVKLFRFFQRDQAFAVATFSENEITWISPDLNQIHQLKNLDGNIETCITIQCYMYDSEDHQHYNYFDYLDANNKIKQFEPDSDMDFQEFKKIIKAEWDAHLKFEMDNFLNSKLN